MVSFTALATAISVALLATTTNAAPAVVAERDTSSVLQFTLYKTLQSGSENECWWGAPGNNFGSVPPSELVPASPPSTSNCHQGDFYTLRIYNEDPAYKCEVKTYKDDTCSQFVGSVPYEPSKFGTPCKFPGGSLVNLHSWKVSCV
ncbi:hypothetical protein BGZ57DRAFT_954337 [Hyaloscypha finlandica]|nr:hypothetical protein BGZ57DRAFT_954337 [Hyaloscypha finlandica]KAH8773906.1 hypothetical protein F5882DRAFT_410075 [Hyaloscypha sp. PMI_1271]